MDKLNIMRKLPAICLIATVCASCNRTNVDNELAQIDSLKTEIKNAEILLGKLDAGKIMSVHEQMTNQIELAKSLYGDSIDWEQAKLLSGYHNLGKSFSKYINSLSFLKDEITYSYSQLQDLATDLRNAQVPADSFTVYLRRECEAVKELEGLIQRTSEQAGVAIQTYTESSPRIEALLQGGQSPDAK